ncbi:hypothetical protein C1645_741635 [Glomus cerebriforme]|uniref:DNA ligase OB-like domain-containing protein n=1 Tax=Glomus cerebriforme TaxID=658196 RepID=A0A397SIE0_9GLOM|nr:hypothetical protein C1645_741635 [Glomus cerebriforme]
MFSIWFVKDDLYINCGTNGQYENFQLLLNYCKPASMIRVRSACLAANFASSNKRRYLSTLNSELFVRRGKFQSTISIVKAGVEEWKNIRYEIFDVPSLGKIPFEDRMNHLKNMMVKNKMASGKEFKVGSRMNNYERANPLTVGSIIIYKCQELLNSSSPRFPIYLSLALDKDAPSDPDFGQS